MLVTDVDEDPVFVSVDFNDGAATKVPDLPRAVLEFPSVGRLLGSKVPASDV